MDFLRKTINWLRSHRFISLIGTLLIVILIIFVRTIITRSEGTLSGPIHRGAAVDAVYGIGTVTALRSYAFRPGVTSTIYNLYVKEGDFIHKGDKLANIDHVLYRAPFDGVVNYSPFKVGENVFSQLPVIVLTDPANRYLVVSLEQQGALRVRVGQKAKLSFDSIRNQNFDGVIQSVYWYNSNFFARIDVSSLPPEILPDMTADVAIIIRELANALLVPASAVDNDSVWVKRSHRIPSRVSIKLGVVDGTMAEVLSGDLKEGDQVLIRRKVGK
ncbi:MAG: HlyD family efflux transporter periplasmic adaptor subunit [Bacteriovorax sp.]|nr:HlyD family efflux transporter periplasmic adaptor subunit [Bacteriovorax sp.]